MSTPADPTTTAAPQDDAEARRTLALRLAVELRRSEDRDITSGYVTRTAQAFEAYLRAGTVAT